MIYKDQEPAGTPKAFMPIIGHHNMRLSPNLLGIVACIACKADAFDMTTC